nr:hypothetical protein [Tanacetum cinerariifolium]
MGEFMNKPRAQYYLASSSMTTDGVGRYELEGEFLKDLQRNAFSGTNGEDVVEHIDYFLKIVDPIDLPNKSDIQGGMTLKLLRVQRFRRNIQDVVKKMVQMMRRMDVVFDGAFGGAGDAEVIVGEGVVVISSSLDMLTNSYLGGIMVSLIFWKGLDEEALVEFMVEWCEEDEDDEDELFN